MSDNKSKYNSDSQGHTYDRQSKGWWDIDTSDRTQRESDSGHIPGRYQWEETVDVSKDDEDWIVLAYQIALPLIFDEALKKVCKLNKGLLWYY